VSNAEWLSDEELVARFPNVRIDHDNKRFYGGWVQRRLLLNRCDDCGWWHHPPRPICPRCWSRRVSPSEVSGRGRVTLLVRLHQGPPAPGVDYSSPLPVATVQLAEQEGLRYTSTVVGCPPERVQIGMAVELTWIERYGAPYPVFRPAAEEGADGSQPH
jgi:uncharacterized OB-fold protein